MYRYQKFIHLTVFVIIVAFTFNLDYNPFIINDAETVALSMKDTAKIDTSLYKEIIEKKSKYYEDPENAYIDRVWKKTPGRNGIQLNVDKTYEKMKKGKTFNESLVVLEQISPEISLKELSPSPIYRGHPEKKMVAFLINVSWGTEHIPEILNILKEEKIKVTFFIEGKWAKENTDIVKMIDEQGHIIGNHAYNHPDMARLSKQENMDQIKQTNDIIKAIIGKTPVWFAPPSGSFTDEVVEIAHNLQMETILWTVDTVDWKKPSVSVMINHVINNVHPGAMILMHPTLPVVKGLKPMITEIKQLGYKISTVETLLSNDR